MSEVELALDIIGLVPEIDQCSFVDPTTYCGDRETLLEATSVLMLVNTEDSDDQLISRAVRAAKLISSNNLRPIIVIAIGNGLLSDTLLATDWAIIRYREHTEENLLTSSMIISDILADENEPEAMIMVGSANKAQGKWICASDVFLLICSFLIGSLPPMLVLAYESEIRHALLNVLPLGFVRFAYLFITLLVMGISLTAMVGVTLPLFRRVARARSNRLRYEEHLDAMRYSRRLRRVVRYDDNADGDSHFVVGARRVDALERMLVNLEDIKQYYTWSQDQARSAFHLARGLCIAGFVLLAVATLLPGLLGMGWEAAVIPAIGGAVTELVAGTTLLVYRRSVSQLNHYHKALHEDERFLSSVSLVDRFETPERRDEILTEIVRSELAMNLAASRAEARSEGRDKEQMTEDCFDEEAASDAG